MGSQSLLELSMLFNLNTLRVAAVAIPLAACTHTASGPVVQAGRTTARPVYRSAAVVLPTAERYIGVKYKWGGTSPRTGFDCSGYVQYVFARHGVRLPRTSRAQVKAGDWVRPEVAALRPGDLIMFAQRGKPISHVAIYAGDQRIIHSSKSGRGVRYDNLRTRRGAWFRNNMVAARRVLPPGAGAGMIRDLVSELRAKGIRVEYTLDLGDFAPKP